MTAKSKKRKSENHDSDIVWGASEIGKVIGRTERATFHLLEQKRLPARRIAGAEPETRGMYVASRRRLLAYLSGDAAE